LIQSALHIQMVRLFPCNNLSVLNVIWIPNKSALVSNGKILNFIMKSTIWNAGTFAWASNGKLSFDSQASAAHDLNVCKLKGYCILSITHNAFFGRSELSEVFSCFYSFASGGFWVKKGKNYSWILNIHQNRKLWKH
jgi:hypothetical protein